MLANQEGEGGKAADQCQLRFSTDIAGTESQNARTVRRLREQRSMRVSDAGRAAMFIVKFGRVVSIPTQNRIQKALAASAQDRDASPGYKATSSTRLTSRTWLPARSSSTGIRSRSSLSCASENQLLIGTACWGWKMYEVGELSMMMVS